MKLIYNECDNGGFYVCEDPFHSKVNFMDVGVGRGDTIEQAKADYLLRCREYAVFLRQKSDAIYNNALDCREHEMRREE